MNDKVYKKQNKMAACTEAPWKSFIPLEIREQTLLKIKQESLDIYGQDLSGECPKRLVCFSKECIGRPLPLFSPTAKPYLDQLTETQIIINDELYIATNCQGCPIVKTCSSSCSQINDYIERDKTIEPPIVYGAITENSESNEFIEESGTLNVSAKDIPWDCLSKRRSKIVKMYLFEGKDFNHISKILDLNGQAEVKYLYYSSATKLSKYGVVRKFLESNPKISKKRKIIIEKHFYENKSLVTIAKELGVTKQVCQQSLRVFYKKHKLKWKKYVFKRGSEVVYNTVLVLQ